MLSGREFTLGGAAGAYLKGPGSINALTAGTPTQVALVIGAMGKIREVYNDELCREMIDSGINAVTVTLCDPRFFEEQACACAINGALECDRLIAGDETAPRTAAVSPRRQR